MFTPFYLILLISSYVKHCLLVPDYLYALPYLLVFTYVTTLETQENT